ncbi:MAG: hypothetical protein ACW963_09200, partial [Candidatus Sifarchaeia archaeon]
MRTTNNPFVLTLVALFAMLVSFGCSDISVEPQVEVWDPGVIGVNDVKASEPFYYEVNLASQNTLKVEGINGVVDVQSVSGTNQVTISGEKVVGSKTYSDAKENLKNVRVEIDELTNELLVKTIQPKYSDGRNYNVHYTIRIPSHLNVVVEHINGKISGKVSVPMNGTVDLSLQNGSIELSIPQSTSSDFYSSLVNGKISVEYITLFNRVETSKTLKGTFGDGQGMISLRTS